jgi:hypothetical protein
LIKKSSQYSNQSDFELENSLLQNAEKSLESEKRYSIDLIEHKSKRQSNRFCVVNCDQICKSSKQINIIFQYIKYINVNFAILSKSIFQSLDFFAARPRRESV